MSVVDTAQLSQSCNQDSFDATYPVICENRYFSSHLQDPEAMPFVILAKNQPCFFLLFDIFTPFSKKDASIRSVLELFSPIFKKKQKRCKYDSVRIASLTERAWYGCRTSSYPGNLCFRSSTQNANQAFSKSAILVPENAVCMETEG